MKLPASVAVAGLVVALVGVSGCTPDRCAICYMPIPRETRAVVRIDGTREVVTCDARCPLTLQEQSQRRARLVRVTDYATGEWLDPAQAVYVVGSDTAPDAHTVAVRTTGGDAAYLHWHRCLPSVLAFRTRDAATAFSARHGGAILTLAELGFAGS